MKTIGNIIEIGWRHQNKSSSRILSYRSRTFQKSNTRISSIGQEHFFRNIAFSHANPNFKSMIFFIPFDSNFDLIASKIC